MTAPLKITDEQVISLREFYAGEGGWTTPCVDDLLEMGLIDWEEHYDGYAMWLTPLGEATLEANNARLPR